jgi:hypothetical protein
MTACAVIECSAANGKFVVLLQTTLVHNFVTNLASVSGQMQRACTNSVLVTV